MKKEAARHGFNFILSVMEIHTCFSAAAEWANMELWDNPANLNLQRNTKKKQNSVTSLLFCDLVSL